MGRYEPCGAYGTRRVRRGARELILGRTRGRTQQRGEPRSQERRESVKFCARHEVRGPAPSRSRTRFAGSDARDAVRPDASDCARITNASDNTYVLRQGDAGFRIRSQVVARNADGQDTATSNPTNVVTAAKPVNTTEPSISGTAEGWQHTSGQPRTVGRGRADHVHVRLASLQRQGRQLQRDPGRERPELRGSRRRYGANDPRPRDRP